MEKLIIALNAVIAAGNLCRNIKLSDDDIYDLVRISGNICSRIAIEAQSQIKGKIELTEEEKDSVLLSKGNIITAIKSLRDRTGLGLKELKDLVEDFRAGNMHKNRLGEWVRD